MTPRRNWTRRQVLRAGAGCAGALAFASACGKRVAAAVRARGTLVGPGFDSAAPARPDGGKPYVLALLDLDQPAESVRTIPLDFMAHGVVFDPLRPERALLFEKRGPGAALVDLLQLEVLETIPTTREFYGHGAFTPDGALLYATETVVEDDYRGVIVVRDGRTLEELGEFPSFGPAPHDCTLIDAGRTLVITNGGARRRGGAAACVTYVDVQTQALIERLEFADADLTAGHLAVSSKGDLAVSSSIRPWLPEQALGAASFRPAGGLFRTMTEPRAVTGRMLGESLSLAIHEPSGVVAITNPTGHVVTFWDLAEGRLLSALDLPFPRGVAQTLDREHFVISYGKQTSIVLVSAQSLTPVPATRVSKTHMSGSHLFLHNGPQLSS